MNARLADDLKQHLAVAACLRPRGWRPTSGGARHERDIAHLYYRATAKAPNLRAEGLPVDIKTGPRAYVAGPWSIRPDGGIYRPAKGLLGVDPLPLLRGIVTPENRGVSATIPAGHRHVALVKEAIKMLELVDSAEELEANLAAVRDDLCEDAVTMPDTELRALAGWAWTLRLENRIFRGRDSALSIDRLALDALRRWENETDAIALYLLLIDRHGQHHTTGRRRASLEQAGPHLCRADGSLEAIPDKRAAEGHGRACDGERGRAGGCGDSRDRGRG